MKKVIILKNKGTDMFQAIQEGNNDIARINAGNSIRKEQERLNLLRLASRVDAVASRVRTAITMRSVRSNPISLL